jgi:molybdopterin converting factor small subunit
MTEYLTMFLNDRPVLDFDIVLGEGDDVLLMFPVSGG